MERLCIQSAGYGTLALAEHLRENELEYDKCINWYAYGTATLVLFFKILGKTYTQIMGELEGLKLLGDFFPYNSIVSHPAEKNLDYVSEYLSKHLKGSLFDSLSSMKDVKRILGVECTFVMYNKERNILEFTDEDSNLIESVLASLCSPSVYNEYKGWGCGLTVYPTVPDFKGKYILSYPTDMKSENPDIFFPVERMLCLDYSRRLELLCPEDVVKLPYVHQK